MPNTAAPHCWPMSSLPPFSDQSLPANCSPSWYWTGCPMVGDIPLASSGQLSWPVPSHLLACLLTGSLRHQTVLEWGKHCAATTKTSAVISIAPILKPKQLLGRKLPLSQPKPGHRHPQQGTLSLLQSFPAPPGTTHDCKPTPLHSTKVVHYWDKTPT